MKRENYLYIDQRRGVITLIPKPDKDLRYLSNWRPISLLNTDYKILAKALATRLQGVIHNIINSDQTGYIKQRFIGQNIRTIDDIMDYCDAHGTSGIIAMLDFQKAFDSVSWTFLIKCLQSFNFGEGFQKWIKTLYYNVSSCVTNNGYSSQFFNVERGVRQGCPISPLLFVIVAEILACKIRSDPEIKGININQETFTITQLADDTTLFLSDIKSLERALMVLGQFAILSGLLLNKNKTQVLYVGSNIEQAELPSLGIKWIKNSFKTLGITFYKDKETMLQVNFTECLKKIKTLLNIWRQRALSLRGKVTILKALIVPKIIYLASMLFVPKWFIKKVEASFMEFLWDGKPSKIKKTTIIGELNQGGLKFPHVESIIKALKLSWVKRLLCSTSDGRWITLSKTMMGITTEELKSPTLLKYIDTSPSPFYVQLLETWFGSYSVEPVNAEAVLLQPLWHNAFILVGGKPIRQGFRDWVNQNIKYVKDITNLDTGQLLGPVVRN